MACVSRHNNDFSRLFLAAICGIFDFLENTYCFSNRNSDVSCFSLSNPHTNYIKNIWLSIVEDDWIIFLVHIEILSRKDSVFL